MAQRIVSIWFPHLLTDWMQRHQKDLRDIPFALAAPEKNRRVVKAVNVLAQQKGAGINLPVADCRAIVPELNVFDYDPAQASKLLLALAEWFICYTPYVSIDGVDGLFLDASGCTHLWGGEASYLKHIYRKCRHFGYKVRLAMSDTAGCSWAISRFGENGTLVLSGMEAKALSSLTPAALRLDDQVLERLAKLGLQTIGSFMSMARTALRRRFGQAILTRLDQALGAELEMLEALKPVAPYQERLPSLEPICTAGGIETALKTLLEALCLRLTRESKGLRHCNFLCYRLDGNIQQINIGTKLPSRNVLHLFKLFEVRIPEMEPDLGFELFVLEATVVEELYGTQDALWAIGSANETAIAELLDRLACKTGEKAIHRYLPAQHHWPERSIKEANSLTEKPGSQWRSELPRPLHLLPSPELIDVSVPMPDYPPLLFVYKGVRHLVKKADGPERIEEEWWVRDGLYRDYYCVEDELGARYWLFRMGDYSNGDTKWYLHGFFS